MRAVRLGSGICQRIVRPARFRSRSIKYRIRARRCDLTRATRMSPLGARKTLVNPICVRPWALGTPVPMDNWSEFLRPRLARPARTQINRCDTSVPKRPTPFFGALQYAKSQMPIPHYLRVRIIKSKTSLAKVGWDWFIPPSKPL